MKRVIVYLAIMSLAGCQARTANQKLAGIKSIPSFKILSVDSSQCINSDNITYGCPVVFMYFDPECEHCQWETQNIMHHISELQHAKIYLITDHESPKVISQFSAYFHINTALNIFVGRDFNYSFFRAYSAPQVPYMAIYDSHRKLKKIYQGETDIQSVINAVQD